MRDRTESFNEQISQDLFEGEINSILASPLRFLRSVAVGTALASGLPHRSVREEFPPTALTSGSSDGQPLFAACRTNHNLCDSLPRLCVRHECACGAFPLVDLLPSADSAANAYPPALFARFLGTMRPSDSLQTSMSTLPHCYPVWASVGPPDSRAWSFLTCLGSLTPRC